MTISAQQTAHLRALLDKSDAIGTNASMRLIAAAVSHVTLVHTGAAERHGAEKVAKVAWDLGDAFLDQAVARLLPNGIK